MEVRITGLVYYLIEVHITTSNSAHSYTRNSLVYIRCLADNYPTVTYKRLVQSKLLSNLLEKDFELANAVSYHTTRFCFESGRVI